MLRIEHYALTALVAAVGSLLLIQEAGAQARSGIDSPGLTFGSPGSETSVGTFRRYSYGLGSLGGGGTNNSLLRSRGGGMSIRRSSRGGQTSGMPGTNYLDTRPQGRRYSSGTSSLIGEASDAAKRTRGAWRPGRQESTFGTGQGEMTPYGDLTALEVLDAVNSGQSVLTDVDETITSLVPSQPGKYKDYMRQGEKALGEERYPDAIRKFRVANQFHGDDPETLLNLMHAHAASGTSYATAGYYLRRTLEVLPELPLLPIEPKAILTLEDDPLADEVYAKRIRLLAEATESATSNHDAAMVLAYFRWFEGDVEAATESLRNAVEWSPEHEQERMLEAATTFWRAMRETGKVSGSLLATAPSAQASDSEAQGPASGSSSPSDG
ncbi:MAG: hypothetical protein ACOC93_01820 [Planctomycetota bacterium]